MNPLSLLPPPPPPSNFFSDLPSLPPSSPHHGTNTPAGWQQQATNEPGRRAVRIYLRVRVRVLFTARARIGRSTLKILFFLLAYIPNPHLLYVLYTRHDRRARVPSVRSTPLVFLPLPLLKLPPPPPAPLPPPISADFFSNPRPLSSATLRGLLRDQRDKVPLPRRSRFLSCGKLVPVGRLRASLYYQPRHSVNTVPIVHGTIVAA